MFFSQMLCFYYLFLQVFTSFRNPCLHHQLHHKPHYILDNADVMPDSISGFDLCSSPEPLGSQGELIVYPCCGVRPSSSVVRTSTISNIFSSETARPIKAKFYVEPPWEGGTKVCINGRGHMTKMAAMPIYGQNLKQSSSPESAGRFPQNLVCSIGDSCPS